MEITLHKEDVSSYDTGGGIRQVEATITVDETLSKRQQRKVALYEALGCCLDYAIGHEQLENIADLLVEVLDQLEPV